MMSQMRILFVAGNASPDAVSHGEPACTAAVFYTGVEFSRRCSCCL